MYHNTIDGHEEYEVEKILAHRQYGRNQQMQYLVKWQGYPDSDNTWEPKENLHADELLQEYKTRSTHARMVKTKDYSRTTPLQSMYQRLQGILE